MLDQIKQSPLVSLFLSHLFIVQLIKVVERLKAQQDLLHIVHCHILQSIIRHGVCHIELYWLEHSQWLYYAEYNQIINMVFPLSFSTALSYINSLNTINGNQGDWNDRIVEFDLKHFKYDDNKAKRGQLRKGFGLAIGF